MVKHQRRSHQRGLLPNEALDDCTSDSDSGESPMTPRMSSTSWSTPAAEDRYSQTAVNPALRRAQSYTENMQQQYSAQAPYTGRAPSHNQSPHHEASLAMVDQSNLVPVMHRTAVQTPEAFYVTDHHNPGVATMNTSGIQRTYQPQRTVIDHAPMDVPYQTTPVEEIRNSPGPGRYALASGRSPAPQAALYAPPMHGVTYTVPSSQTLESQGPMMQYGPQVSQPLPRSHHQIPPRALQSVPSTTVPYHQPSPTVESEPWYQYQAPVEVTTIGQLPVFGSGIFDMYGGPKIEFDDPSMQMPSARVETL